MEKICVIEAEKVKSKDALKNLPVSELSKWVIEKEKTPNLELDVNYKQIIVSAVVKYKDEYLLYRRDNTEERLKGLWSCLAGGHARYPDKIKVIGKENEYVLADEINGIWFLNEMIREFQEEFRVTGGYVEACDFKFSGYLNINSNAVSKVHLGLIYVIKVPTRIRMQIECSEQRYCSFGALGHNLIDTEEPAEVWSSSLIQVLRDTNHSEFPVNALMVKDKFKNFNLPVMTISEYYEGK